MIGQPVPQLALDRTSSDTLTVRLSGTWRMSAGLPSSEPLQGELAAAPPVRRIAFDTRDVATWDTSLVAFGANVLRLAEARRLAVDRGGLPRGVQRLLALAEAVPESKTRTADTHASWLAGVGAVAIAAGAAAGEILHFIGEAILALGRLLGGTARFRSSDLALIVQQCGANALPIITLVSFLVGLILAFMGANQLRQLGAQIYVADLVAIAAAREMAGMMTGIVMAGRTGAAFAAQLGTMKVNEEIDALITFGISPMDFLVLPRMLALILMMPLLTIYSLAVSLVGGVVVSVAVFGIDCSRSSGLVTPRYPPTISGRS